MKKRIIWVGLLACLCMVAGYAAVEVLTAALTAVEVTLQTPELSSSASGSNLEAITTRIVAARKLNDGSTTPRNVEASGTNIIQLDASGLAGIPVNLNPVIARQDVVFPKFSKVEKVSGLDHRTQPIRPPSNPLDQGTDACPGTDLGSALGLVASGTTVGYANNWGPYSVVPACWQGGLYSPSHASPDVCYKWTAPATGTYTFSTCPNDYDTGIGLWNYTCPTPPAYPANLICGNDDGGPCGTAPSYGSQLDCIPLTGGQIVLITIDGYGGDAGTYDLTITSCECENNCVNNEGEPVCVDQYDDNTNGGCLASPNEFTELNGACPHSICGHGGVYVINQDTIGRDTDWFEKVFATDTYLRWTFIGERAFDLVVTGPGPVGDECNVDSLPLYGLTTASACDTTILQGCIPAGTYWFFVAAVFDVNTACGTEYSFSVECLPCCDASFASSVNCAGATPAISGNTTGADDPCYNIPPIPTDIWEITVTEDALYSFSLCGGTDWDSYIWISSECCGTPICNNDDGCTTPSLLSAIQCCQLTAGTYFLHVSGFSSADFGPYSVNISCCGACIVDCGANTEGEPVCADDYVDVTNNGCGGGELGSFSTIVCGQTVCGASGTFSTVDGDSRDTDWFELTLTQQSIITWSATAEFNVQLYILTPGIPPNECSVGFVVGDSALACSTATAITNCLDPGTYWLFLAPTLYQAFTLGVPCGANYLATLDCEPCVSTDFMCPELTMYGDEPDRAGDGPTIAISDSSVQGIFTRYDNFNNASSPICDIHWWGANVAFTGTFQQCLTEDPMTFQIKFYADNGSGQPVTTPTCSYTVAVAREVTPDQFIWDFNGDTCLASNLYYSTDLNPCCTLTSGWVSIRGVSPGGCLFYWHSSGGFNGGQSWYRTAAGPLTNATFNLSKCLTQNPPPCLPANNLTIYMTPGNGNAKLDWQAAQAGSYQVYSTNSPNTPNYPNVAWNLETTINVGAPGSATWTDPSAFVNYKRYAVVHVCP